MCIALILICSSLSFAGSGQAFISKWEALESTNEYFTNTNLMITNIGNASVDVDLNLFSNTGDAYESCTISGSELSCKVDGGANPINIIIKKYKDGTLSSPTDSTADFTIESGFSVSVEISNTNGTSHKGHGVISWSTSTSGPASSLIAEGSSTTRSVEGVISYPDGAFSRTLVINGGSPFQSNETPLALLGTQRFWQQVQGRIPV